MRHYNTGTVTALDGRAYAQGTPDFHVAMAEMLLRERFDVPAGWRCQGGFSGGRALLKLDRGFQYLLVDTTGKQLVLLGSLCITAKRFSEGLALVARGKWVNYVHAVRIHVAGNPRPVGARFESAEPLCDCKYAFVDKKGK